MGIRTGSVGLLVLFLEELAGLLPKNKFSISIGKADEDDVLRDIRYQTAGKIGVVLPPKSRERSYYKQLPCCVIKGQIGAEAAFRGSSWKHHQPQPTPTRVNCQRILRDKQERVQPIAHNLNQQSNQYFRSFAWDKTNSGEGTKHLAIDLMPQKDGVAHQSYIRIHLKTRASVRIPNLLTIIALNTIYSSK